MSGPPLILFGLFSLTILVFAIVVALVVGLLVAVAFTLFAVGTALLVLFPTVFFTTLAATFVFLWGLGGFYLIKWFNKGDTPAAPGTSIGDRLNSLTGGRMDFVMDNARKTEDEGKLKEYEKKHGTGPTDKMSEGAPNATANGAPNGTANGTPKKPAGTPAKLSSGASDAKKSAENGTNGIKNTATSGADGIKKNANVNGATNAATTGANAVNKNANVGNVTNKATKTVNVDGVTKKVPVANQASGALGTVKGTAGGATGLV